MSNNTNFKFGDIFLVNYPYEDDKNKYDQRPAIFIKKHANEISALVIKVTKQLKHLGKDKYKLDFEIEKWEESGLEHPSLAQISKAVVISIEELTTKIGSLIEEDIQTLIDGIVRHVKILDEEKRNASNN